MTTVPSQVSDSSALTVRRLGYYVRYWLSISTLLVTFTQHICILYLDTVSIILWKSVDGQTLSWKLWRRVQPDFLAIDRPWYGNDWTFSSNVANISVVTLRTVLFTVVFVFLLYCNRFRTLFETVANVPIMSSFFLQILEITNISWRQDSFLEVQSTDWVLVEIAL